MFKIDSLAVYRQQRDTCTDRAKDLLANAATGWTDQHEAKYKEIVAEIDSIDEASKIAADKLQRQARPEIPDNPVSEFRSAEGQTIYAYAHGQRISESRPDYHIGTLIRGMISPRSVPMQVRNDLAEGADSTGGVSVPIHVLQEFFDLLRSRLVSSQAGVRTIVLDTLKTRVAKLASDPSALWRAENSQILPTEPTFLPIELTAKNLAVLVCASNELLMDSLNIEEIILRTMAAQTALQVDTAIFYGDQADANIPTGIIHDTDIPTVDAGGPLTDYGEVLAGLESLSANNADVTRASVVLNPREFYKLQGLTDSTGQPMQQPTVIANRGMFPTTIVKTDEGGGTESRMFVGDFSNVLLGIRQDANIRVLRERFADFNQTGFLLTLRADVAVAQPKAVCMITGVTP